MKAMAAGHRYWNLYPRQGLIFVSQGLGNCRPCDVTVWPGWAIVPTMPFLACF